MDHHFSPQLHQSSAPFSHFAAADGLGFTAGIIGQDRETGEVVSGDVAVQCEYMMENLQILLREVGRGFQDVVRTTIYLTDYADFGTVNEVYARYFAEPYPVRTTLQVAALPLGAAVQIDTVVKVV
ncbi:Rid family hydrolase [Corynebacterium sp. HMSC28B08]|uniref:Rid family hydrolase n=1 Tax=Corynebacterium TaxID=1716 RepID=UPI0008A1280B|nr:Rid family hydrolase [Corynebacterium sp. HMSC28B08]OFT91092.1 hypothetical protein HMPREF3098_01575 [Corynebacterium sp. HMSC28B08]